MVNENSMREIVSFFIKDAQYQLDYLNKLRSIDVSLTESFDNGYYNSLIQCNNVLLKKLLGENIYEDVMWFLYSRPQEKNGDEIRVTNPEKSYIITDLDSFMDYLNDHYDVFKSEYTGSLVQQKSFYYYWNDVENFLIENLPANFDARLWSFWLDLIGEVNNDSLKTHFIPDILENENSSHFKETFDYHQKTSNFDVSLIFRAIEKLEEYCGSEITIYYSW